MASPSGLSIERAPERTGGRSAAGCAGDGAGGQDARSIGRGATGVASSGSVQGRERDNSPSGRRNGRSGRSVRRKRATRAGGSEQGERTPAGELPQRDRARSHQAGLQSGGVPRLSARQGRAQTFAARLRGGERLHGDRQECRAAAGDALCPRGEPDPAQADAGRGSWRRQAARARVRALSPADRVARAGCAGPARRRPAGRRPESLSRTPADGGRRRAAPGGDRGLERRHRARRDRSGTVRHV